MIFIFLCISSFVFMHISIQFHIHTQTTQIVTITLTHSQCSTKTTKKDCKSSHISSSHCFWHNVYGCISISESPTTHPTTYPSASPTIEPTTATPTISIISSVHCGDTIHGQTSFAHHIDYYTLHIRTQTDLFLDSCQSLFDTWLFLEDSDGPIVDCDDCGDCGLKTQLKLYRMEAKKYIVGIGGYREHFGNYSLHILCNRTLAPTHSPTIISTKNPTPKPTKRPTVNPTLKPTHFPTMYPTHTPTLSPSAKPTVAPSKKMTFSPTYFPTMRPTNDPTLNPSLIPTGNPTLRPTKYPTQRPSMEQYMQSTPDFFSNLSLTENKEQILSIAQSEKSNNGLLVGCIVSLVFIFLFIASCYGLKYLHRSGKYHISIGIDDDEDEDEECDDLEFDDVDIINLIHCGKRNSVNNLNIDEIVERATIDLMNLTKKESESENENENGQTETITKQ